MTHKHIKTQYIRHLLADEIYRSWKAWDGHHLESLYGDDFSMVRFGLDTAFHRIDQRIVSGELIISLSLEQTHSEPNSSADSGKTA